MRCKLAFAIATALITATASANIVVNGGFEAGNLQGWSTSSSPGGHVQVSMNPPRIGQYHAELSASGSGSHAILFQSFAPVPVSQITEGSFYAAGGLQYDFARVLLAGGSYLEFSHLGSWHQVDFLPLLGSGTSVVGFDVEAIGGASFFGGITVDEFRLETVPEPATTGPFLIGLLLCRVRAAH